MNYPTKNQILNERIILIKEEIEYFKKWKNREWKTAKKTQIQKEYTKILALRVLVNEISHIHDKEPPSVVATLTPATKNDSASYNHRHKTIYLHDTSIITTLHELGHHLFGKSELLACAYSVHLFKLVFPKSFKKLRWEGHKLLSISTNNKKGNQNYE